ncbi:fungal hydrophobin-domain-containing protein [Earliella scabrosa]|nr:fungal hydrophobin-domain-containing protein [Earliella scabrosa]
MFARTAALVSVLTLAVLAAATPAANSAAKAKPTKTVTITSTPAPTGGPTGKCSTGPIQCCNTATSAQDPATAALLGLLGIAVQGVNALVGVQCDPINVIGVGAGKECNAQAVCCTNNNVGGLVSLGCVPVTL